GADFGPFGPFEELRGTLQFAVDPAHPDHGVIADLGLAPTGADGRVHFESDFLIVKPVQPRPNSSLLYQVLNRGRGAVIFNDAEPEGPGGGLDPGNGFLFRHGFSLLLCGWQHDVPSGLAIRVPEALENGQRIRGQAFIQYQLNRGAPALLLSDAGHKPLPAADLNDPGAMLTVREHPDGEPRTIARTAWEFARVEDGRAIPDANYVHLKDGFEPGLVYEITYTTEGAPVIGLGFLSMRDSVSWLKFGT